MKKRASIVHNCAARIGALSSGSDGTLTKLPSNHLFFYLWGNIAAFPRVYCTSSRSLSSQHSSVHRAQVGFFSPRFGPKFNDENSERLCDFGVPKWCQIFLRPVVQCVRVSFKRRC